MASRPNALLERFYTALISGDRAAAAEVLADCRGPKATAEALASHLIWPTLEQLQKAHRHDQLSELSYHFATRLMRSITDRLQPQYKQKKRRNQNLLLVCGEEESEELAGQLTADLLEADGWTVFFAGGGVANDELVAAVGNLAIDRLVVFGAVPATVPRTRQLIDRLHDMGLNEQVQVTVGGGVFARADGLGEEIGADLWADHPTHVVEVIDDEPQQRMTSNQRTVGRKRRKAA